MDTSTNPDFPPGRDLPRSERPHFGFVDNPGSQFLQASQADSFPSGPWTQMSSMLERTNFHFSNTLSDFAGVLGRMFDLQNMVSKWKYQYERLYEDHRDLSDRFDSLSTINAQMNIDLTTKNDIIREKEGLITLLQAEVQELEAIVASQRLSGFPPRADDEFGGLPLADLSHFVSSPSECFGGKEELDFENETLGTTKL